MKYATVSIHIGWRGDNVWIAGGTEWSEDHPIVRAYPDYFTDTPPAGVKPAPKKRRATKSAAGEPTSKGTATQKPDGE